MLLIGLDFEKCTLCGLAHLPQTIHRRPNYTADSISRYCNGNVFQRLQKMCDLRVLSQRSSHPLFLLKIHNSRVLNNAYPERRQDVRRQCSTTAIQCSTTAIQHSRTITYPCSPSYCSPQGRSRRRRGGNPRSRRYDAVDPQATRPTRHSAVSETGCKTFRSYANAMSNSDADELVVETRCHPSRRHRKHAQATTSVHEAVQPRPRTERHRRGRVHCLCR